MCMTQYKCKKYLLSIGGMVAQSFKVKFVIEIQRPIPIETGYWYLTVVRNCVDAFTKLDFIYI